MRVLLLALVALLPLVLAAPQPELIDASNIESMWEQSGELQLRLGFGDFKAQFGKQYESAEMEEYRFGLFKQNMERAAELQKLNPTAKFGATKFADLHPSEFKRQYLNFRPGVSSSALLRRAAEVRQPKTKCAASLPTDFDWRAPDGGRPSAITAVKDQGQCGSCWAFSATEELESAWILAGNKPIALSPQQVVSCDGGDGGCNGGDLPTAYAYIEKAGLEAESSYPYKSGNSGDSGKCQFDKSKVVATMKSWKYATTNCEDSCQKQDEETLKKNIYEAGPAAICVDAEPWQMYQSGVLTASSGCQNAYNELDHCVQLTGFGRDNSTGQAFWSVRNSWSSSWGEQGFIRLLYGANTCGVADEAVQVIIN